METKHVVAAVILHGGKVFATQRGYGEFKDKWEFPGGKIEPGETPEEALAREIREGLVQSRYVPHKATIEVMQILDECRRQMGLVYPFEQEGEEKI